MIFNVTRAKIFGPTLELIKKLRRIFAQNIDQHIEPTSVGHADNNFLGPVATNPLYRLRHHRD